MVQPQLILERVSIFHILFEKRNKNLNNLQALNLKQMSEPVKELLQKNITDLWNMKESETKIRKGESPRIELHSGFKIKKKPTAYVLRFEDQEIKTESPGERFSILDAVRTSESDASFAKNCKALAEFYKEESLSRKAFLIISQFLVSFNGGSPEKFVAILMTNVRPDLYNLDSEKIFDHISGEPFEEAFKKGIIFPHIISENGEYKIVTDKVKMFQKSPFTGYFHKFLRLQPPVDPQDNIEKVLSGLNDNGFKISSLEEFERYFDKKDIFKDVKVDIVIDSFNFKVPWSELKEKISLVKLGADSYGVLIKSSKISIKLGDRDLIEEMKIPLLSKAEFLKLFEEKD